jgi:hypothetical protein
MRWEHKKVPPKQAGQKRTIRRFALFPTVVEDESGREITVWLEHYYSVQEVTDGGYYGSPKWTTIVRYASDPVIDLAVLALQ